MTINKISNSNFKIVNIFITIIFSVFLIGLVTGPVLVNIFIFSLFIIFLHSVKKKIYLINNIDLAVKLQLILCLYIILSSIFIVEENEKFYKSFFYFRFFLVAFVISRILEFQYKTLNYITLIFLVFSVFLSIDIFYQFLTGYDFFGYKAGICVYPEGKYLARNCERFSGFFGNELIAGNFLATYGIFFLFMFFSKFNHFIYKQLLSLVFLVFIILGIILSGERNAVLALFIIFLFNLIFNKKYRKKLFLIFSFFVLIFYTLFTNIENVKYRYFEWPIEYVSNMKGDGFKKILETSWGGHYVTAYAIFKNNKIFGSGYKSFRNECKKDQYSNTNLNKKFKLNLSQDGCATHPHNLYLEVLSELGLVGFLIFLGVLYFTIFHRFFKNFRNIIDKGEIIILLSIILTFIFPFKPTGSFSSSVFSTNMWFFIGFYLYFTNKLNYK